MTKVATIDLGIAEGTRREIADGLARVLADTYPLYLKTHNYHWNVTGPQFNALHLMFEGQYTELALAVDQIAERIRALGEPAPGTYREFSALSSIGEDIDRPGAEEMVRRLELGQEAIVRTEGSQRQAFAEEKRRLEQSGAARQRALEEEHQQRQAALDVRFEMEDQALEAEHRQHQAALDERFEMEDQALGAEHRARKNALDDDHRARRQALDNVFREERRQLDRRLDLLDEEYDKRRRAEEKAYEAQREEAEFMIRTTWGAEREGWIARLAAIEEGHEAAQRTLLAATPGAVFGFGCSRRQTVS